MCQLESCSLRIHPDCTKVFNETARVKCSTTNIRLEEREREFKYYVNDYMPSHVNAGDNNSFDYE